MATITGRNKSIKFTKAFKKECEEAHIIVAHSHAWGDKGNAGVNYKRGKNAHKYK